MSGIEIEESYHGNTGSNSSGDFRHESGADTHFLFLDAGAEILHIGGTGTGDIAEFQAADILLKQNVTVSATLYINSTSDGYLTHDGTVMEIRAGGAGNSLDLYANNIKQVGLSTGGIAFLTDTVLYSRTDSNRGAAGTAGRIIFNTDDGQLNIDDGTNWTLPDGTTT